MDLTYIKGYVHHRAKAFAGFAAPAITGAIIEALEKTFGLTLGTETKVMIVSFVTSQVVYWVSNGPKEGTS